MKCPTDNATLLITERQGIEIDYCPDCRGVWLDRGELDKLLRKADHDGDDDDRRPRHGADRRDTDRIDSYPPKKKKGWLSEMFEVD